MSICVPPGGPGVVLGSDQIGFQGGVPVYTTNGGPVTQFGSQLLATVSGITNSITIPIVGNHPTVRLQIVGEDYADNDLYIQLDGDTGMHYMQAQDIGGGVPAPRSNFIVQSFNGPHNHAFWSMIDIVRTPDPGGIVTPVNMVKIYSNTTNDGVDGPNRQYGWRTGAVAPLSSITLFWGSPGDGKLSARIVGLEG